MTNFKIYLKKIFIFIVISQKLILSTIHVFGNSHSSFFFTNQKPVLVYEEALINYNSHRYNYLVKDKLITLVKDLLVN